MQHATKSPETRILSDYQNVDYDPGRGRTIRLVWYLVSTLIFESGWFPFSRGKARILRLFGAEIGKGLVIHPNVRIKYPWRLAIGDNCWIGREAWLDNLADIKLESDVCISQGAYLCTGSHDHKSQTFDLKTGPIVIEHGAWICCRAIILGNSRVSRMTVVSAGEVYSPGSELNTANQPNEIRKPR